MLLLRVLYEWNSINRMIFTAHSSSLDRQLRRKFRNGSRQCRQEIYKDRKKLDNEATHYQWKGQLDSCQKAAQVFDVRTSKTLWFLWFSGRSVQQRTLPLPIMTHRNSQALANSVKTRSIMFWRSLPKDLDISKVSLVNFKVLVYDFLVSSRNTTIVKY